MYERRRFVTAFTTTRHLSIFWATLIQSTPLHPTFYRHIFFHLRLGITTGLFPSSPLLQNPVCICFPQTCHTPFPSHYPSFITPLKRGEEQKIRSFSLCNFLQLTVTSSIFDPNIFLSTLHSNTLSLQCTVNRGNQDSSQYKITVK